MVDARPKVIGLGLGKTGTKSLQSALVSLGYSNHTWSPELIERWYRGDFAAIFAVTDAYDCVEDWPFASLYAELMDRYRASARYVLTVRKSPEVWLRSTIGHADLTGPKYNVLRRMVFGHDHPRDSEAAHLAFYEQHNAGVRAAIAERGLQDCFAELCFENGHGWPELCALIGRKPPLRAFPHSNQRPDAILATLGISIDASGVLRISAAATRGRAGGRG